MPKPTAPHSNEILIAQEVVHFDPAAFDMQLRSQGVLMEHHVAILCPLGVDDRFDIRSHGDHPNCSNGFIYKRVGDVTVFFSGNSSNSTLQDLGMIDGSTTQITLPRHYDSPDKEIHVQHYDRFYLKEIAGMSVNTQRVEAHVTGVDRLQYPAVEVEFIMDANGVEYGPEDYRIDTLGNIVWTSDKRPQFDPKLSRGTVYSIRYHYIPFWYVKNILHEVRVCRTYDFQENREQLQRMPYAVQLQREYAFENEQRSVPEPDGTPNSGTSTMRSVKAPRNGSFGPR